LVSSSASSPLAASVTTQNNALAEYWQILAQTRLRPKIVVVSNFHLEKLSNNTSLTQGKRVFLTPLRHEFRDEIFRLNTGNVRQEFIPFQNKSGVSFWIEDVLAQMKAEKRIELVILRQINLEFLGMISVRNLQHLPEFGIWIKTSAQRQGFALESLGLFLKWLELYQPPKKYLYTASSTNNPSIQLALRAGFKYLGENQKDGQSSLSFELRLPVEKPAS
jgi:[ribosomal protein S5]-alanine N-acetyltransferase